MNIQLGLFTEPTLPLPNPFADERGYTSSVAFTELRVRTRISPDDLERKKGKHLKASDLDVLLTGPTAVYLPNGQLMAKYLPGVLLVDGLKEQSIGTLREIGKQLTDNRGLASGYERGLLKPEATRTRTPLVPSAMVGSADPGGAYRYCRLTAWTGKEWDKWVGLHPLFQTINGYFKHYVPDRYAVQENFAEQTHDEWVVPGTVFTTITVNRSYPTGVHTDAGDLEAGFSNLAVLRTGDYSGGIFTFPEYRVGVDMQDGDLLLMDAHQWHGNTEMWCNVCGEGMGAPRNSVNTKLVGEDRLFPDHEKCGTERISIVCYYRTKMVECGTREEEEARAKAWGEKRIDLHVTEAQEYLRAMTLEEMAREATGVA